MKYHEEVAQLYSLLAPYVQRTPLLSSEHFSRELNCKLFFKLETLQPTNSFKVRGACSKMLSLSEEVRKKGVVTASGGNHGLGVCYAARLFQTKAQVFLSKKTPKYRVEKIRTYGGEATVIGESVEEATQLATAFAAKEGKAYIHAFNDDDVIRGQATIALEVLEQNPKIDVIVCSIGGGGLIAGISAYAKSIKPETQIYGVETVGADSMVQSIQAGKIITLEAMTSIADSLGAKRVAEKTFEIARKNVDGFFRVTDQETLDTLVELLQVEKLLVEPAAACSLAALTRHKTPSLAGKNVAVILCGANFQLDVKPIL